MALFAPLPPGPFEVIVPDPPWRFKAWSKKGEGRSASRHYPTLTAEQIATLPVQDIAARHCVLLLWCPGWAMKQAITTVIPAWDFEFKTVATWAKPNGPGIGKWFRESAEYLLLATRGNPRAPLDKDKPSSCFILPRTKRHSAKPVEVLIAIERMFPGRSKIELFCRGRARDGWENWGDEAETSACPQSRTTEGALMMDQPNPDEISSIGLFIMRALTGSWGQVTKLIRSSLFCRRSQYQTCSARATPSAKGVVACRQTSTRPPSRLAQPQPLPIPDRPPHRRSISLDQHEMHHG